MMMASYGNPLMPIEKSLIDRCISLVYRDYLKNPKPENINPILQGDYADPSIMRDGSDYYMTHSSFDYMPGLTVLHSKDLVNWEPISFALKEYLGSVWAPDILKHGDKYYIYFTVAGAPKGGNYVVWADSPYGPWSEPRVLPAAILNFLY